MSSEKKINAQIKVQGRVINTPYFFTASSGVPYFKFVVAVPIYEFFTDSDGNAKMMCNFYDIITKDISGIKDLNIEIDDTLQISGYLKFSSRQTISLLQECEYGKEFVVWATIFPKKVKVVRKNVYS